MNQQLNQLTVEERIRLVEDLWDSIVRDQQLLPLQADQAAELDRRLAAFELDHNTGRIARHAIAEIRRRL